MTHKTEIFPMNICMFNVQEKQWYWIITQYSDESFEEKTLSSFFKLLEGRSYIHMSIFYAHIRVEYTKECLINAFESV